MSNFAELMTIKEASKWASEYLRRNITASNISYLIQYGRVRKIGNNSETRVKKIDLLKYYDSYIGKKEHKWKQKLGNDLNWALSFDQYKEKDTTKHVHRLHPYKGKFIPQLVEYFLDEHTDSFKQKVYFHKNDIILDPFCGSGTTLVQANELGINAIGIDISKFNTQITNTKIGKYDFVELKNEIRNITHRYAEFIHNSNSVLFEKKLLNELAEFNNRYFPTPDFKYEVRNKEIDEWKYGREKEKEFYSIF
ncbi:MAG TPA: site-specific DNA-methyltransferase, partial [Candidatus Cloacimonetes bacterium]|nr:site-specific DNA-methyltransferase [Candidatus Cloacimonadota bacterium]